MKNKITKIVDIVYLIIAILNLCEFIFIRGIFSGIIICLVFGIITLAQIVLSIINRKYYKVMLVTLLGLSIFSGYFILINY